MSEPTHCDCGYEYDNEDIQRNRLCLGDEYEAWLCETCDFEADPT